MTERIIYTAPVLTAQEVEACKDDLAKFIRSNGVHHMVYMIQGIVLENARLVKEVNDLRGQLQIPAMSTHWLSGAKPK